jgi:hypothetical protein
MKFLFIILQILAHSQAYAGETTISGKVDLMAGCSKKAMIWLSLDKENYNERLLLMHTEVPRGGTFRFFVKSGDYQIRGSDEEGCEFLKKVSVKNEDREVQVKLVKK